MSDDSLQQPDTSAKPRRQSRFLPQFNLGSLMWLMLVIGMGIAWWLDRQKFDERLKKLEGIYAPTPQILWSAEDALGPPDDPTGMAGKSWCPQGSISTDTIDLGFDNAITAGTIDIYETYLVGCVTEVCVLDSSGNETSIWSGTDPTPATSRAGVFSVKIPASVKSVDAVRIKLDSTGKGSWPCIDAVGLTDGKGKTQWASSSDCTSVYGNQALSAVKKKKWLGWW